MLDKRVVSAAAAIPILIFCVALGGIVFKAAIVLVMGICIYEYILAYKNTDFKIIKSVIILGYLLVSIFIFLNSFKNIILPIVFLVLILSMATPIFKKEYNVISSALTVTGFIYIVCFFSLLVLIRDNPIGKYLIWIVFIIAWCCDTAAYYSGKFFGKRKLCPRVSPKKTIEGSIGGILGSVIGIIIWGIISRYNVPFNWSLLILLAVIGSVISQIGDLSASLIKRYVGIKDYGYIMPGHGGLLDRFDSILFTIPVVYYYIAILIR